MTCDFESMGGGGAWSVKKKVVIQGKYVVVLKDGEEEVETLSYDFILAGQWFNRNVNHVTRFIYMGI